jgi:hypothetical protein
MVLDALPLPSQVVPAGAGIEPARASTPPPPTHGSDGCELVGERACPEHVGLVVQVLLYWGEGLHEGLCVVMSERQSEDEGGSEVGFDLGA